MTPPNSTFASGFTKPSAWDVVYCINMGVACVIAYAITTLILVPATARDDDLLGGMWAAVAAAFVFRDTRAHSLSAGVARFIATCVSFALCWLYLTILPPTAVGIPILVTLGSLVMMLLNRREDIITTAITTIVIIVVAIMSPSHAQGQPLLRLFDTVVGIGVGVACKWTASAVFSSLRREGAETGKH
jgi:uncharacterized membrane protein YgaE (UPF0421/DUF939 family)